jgi:hypothetical protein
MRSSVSLFPPSSIGTHKYDVRSNIELPKVEVVQVADPEVHEWDNLWHQLVEELSKITPFPTFLVRTPESQRKALAALTHAVCKIAASPMQSPEYVKLSQQYSESCDKIRSLEQENANLRSKLIRMKADHNHELSKVSQRLDTFEVLAAEFQRDREITHGFMERSVATPKPKIHRTRSRVADPDDPDPVVYAHDDRLQAMIHRYDRSADMTACDSDISLVSSSSQVRFESRSATPKSPRKT